MILYHHEAVFSCVCVFIFSLWSLQLNQVADDPLKRPVVYVKGNDAIKLMNIVNKQKVARARIQHRPPRVRHREGDDDDDDDDARDTNREVKGQRGGRVKMVLFYLDVRTKKNFRLCNQSLRPRPKPPLQRGDGLISAGQRAVCSLGRLKTRTARSEVNYLDSEILTELSFSAGRNKTNFRSFEV